MSDGTPPGDPPAPPSGESFDAKMRRWIKETLPSGEVSEEGVEAQMARWLYVLVAVGIALFVGCGGLYFVIWLFTGKK